MEFKHLSLALVLLATSMSGCLGLFGGDDATVDPCEAHEEDINATADHHPECETDDDHDEDHNETEEPDLSVPNVPAVVQYTVTDDMGNVTNTTVVGGNFTFSAAGSFDPDGQLQFVALIMKDSNTTRYATLFAAGEYTPVTFTMDAAGPVNITINALDQRGDISTATGEVFVNSVQTTAGHTFSLGAPVGVTAATCAGPGGSEATAATNSFTRMFKFEVGENATYIQATPMVTLVNAGAPGVEIAICDAAGNAVSPAGETTVTSNVDAMLPAGIDYYVFAVSKSPQNQIESIELVVGFNTHPLA